LLTYGVLEYYRSRGKRLSRARLQMTANRLCRNAEGL
jgi:hypothetical protein